MLTEQELAEIFARHLTEGDISEEEFSTRLPAVKHDLVAAGATSDEVFRVGERLADRAMREDSEISAQQRAALLPLYEEVFGGPLVALRHRVTADAVAWKAMKAADLSDDEIEEALARGHYGPRPDRPRPADDSEKPLGWWGGVRLVVGATVFFALLWSSIPDKQLFSHARRQRGLVLVTVALLQGMRVLFAWAVWQVAWTWLAWVVTLTLAWRVWITANVWWSLAETAASAALRKD